MAVELEENEEFPKEEEISVEEKVGWGTESQSRLGTQLIYLICRNELSEMRKCCWSRNIRRSVRLNRRAHIFYRNDCNNEWVDGKATLAGP